MGILLQSCKFGRSECGCSGKGIDNMSAMKDNMGQGVPGGPAGMISERHQNPALTMNAAVTAKENFSWAAILCVISFVLLVLLMFMQYIEFDAFKGA